MMKGKAELIKSGDYEAQFPLELMLKDLQLLDVTAYEQKQPLFFPGSDIAGVSFLIGHHVIIQR